MMAVVSKFPLLRLPRKEILRTIRVMRLDQQLSFSLISKKCRDLVASINVRGVSIDICINDKIKISVSFDNDPRSIDVFFYTEPDLYWGMGAYGRKKRLTEPESVLAGVIDRSRGSEFTTVEWEKREFAMKNCLEHLQNTFNHHKIDGIWFCHFFSSQFDIDDIREAFGNITKVDIGVTGCFVFNQMILQKFFPIENLSVMTENFQDLKIPLSVLMQNRLKLRIAYDGFPINFTLNDLLLTNSKVITVENPQMPQNLLNNFLKLWQRGSNPHMEYLSFDYFDGEANDEQIIMQGIKHEVNPLDRVRKFKSMGFGDLREVRGGMDVYRMDGVKATITLRKTDFFSFSQMFVWFDHCTVES